MPGPTNRILTNNRKFTIDEIQAYLERYLPHNVALPSFINGKIWNPQSACLNTTPECTDRIHCGTGLLGPLVAPAIVRKGSDWKHSLVAKMPPIE